MRGEAPRGVKTWLVDRGPLVAYLSADDPAHAEVASRLEGFTGRLATTGAVITEAMQFVSASPDGPAALAELVAANDVRVHDLCQPPELRAAATVMKKYRDIPMDFADATLVLLAEGLEAGEVLTLDRRGFSTYRTRRGRALTQVLDRPISP